LTAFKVELERSNQMSSKLHRLAGSVDRERCQGHARCVAVVSELLQLDAFGNDHEIGEDIVPPGLEVKVRPAASDCPKLAISIIEKQADRHAYISPSRAPLSPPGFCRSNPSDFGIDRRTTMGRSSRHTATIRFSAGRPIWIRQWTASACAKPAGGSHMATSGIYRY
jgi:ferredoxin